MPEYTVLLFGPLRELAKVKSAAYELPGDSTPVRALVDKVLVDFPQMKPYLVEDNGDLSANVNIVVDGNDIRSLQTLETVVKPACRIAMFKAAGGG
jgi:molybdopterin converting factor small subunit